MPVSEYGFTLEFRTLPDRSLLTLVFVLAHVDEGGGIDDIRREIVDHFGKAKLAFTKYTEISLVTGRGEREVI